MKKFNMAIIGLILVWSFFAIAFIGWIANIVKFIGEISGPITALFIGRIVGIFMAPLGAVLGFF